MSSSGHSDATREFSDRWHSVLPDQLATRINDVLVVAMCVAYAARPDASVDGVVDYWRTLSSAQRLVHFARAASTVAACLGITL